MSRKIIEYETADGNMISFFQDTMVGAERIAGKKTKLHLVSGVIVVALSYKAVISDMINIHGEAGVTSILDSDTVVTKTKVGS